MREIRVKASNEYSVFVGRGALDKCAELVKNLVCGRKALIVCGDRVAPLYADRVENSLRAEDFEVHRFVYPAGEQSKTLSTVGEVLEAAASAQLDRDDVFIALGGGVTGDLTGLAAALYKRGVKCIQLPTTLLAAVDSSVGGKTAVNLSVGKNLAGIVRQPTMVLCDTDCFRTLPERIVNEGWAEIVKYSVLDGTVYERLHSGADIEDIVCACISCKAELVGRDEFDMGERRLLNLGHTVGHAVEWCTGYRYLHGEAVSIGLSIMARGCEKLGLCSSGTANQIEALLTAHDLPINCDLSASELFGAAKEDKKRSGDTIALIIPNAVGDCRIKESSFELLERIIHAGLT